MKRISCISLLCILLPFLWQGCADDKGNYDYRDLNDLHVTIGSSYSAIARDIFAVRPEVSAREFDADAYTYEWKAYDRTGMREPVLLSTELNLSVILGLQQGSYRLVLNVREKATELYYQATADLEVNTPTSLGWLVLCSDNGRVRLDMVSHIKKTDNVYYDLLKGTELERWHTPYQLECDPDMQEPFYLVTGSGTTRLSSSEFQWNDSYMIGNEFGNGIYEGTVRALASHWPGKIFVDNGGRVYYCNTMMKDGLFGSVRANAFYVEPEVGYNAKATHILPAFMMWDKTNRRFVLCASEFSTLGMDNTRDIPMEDLAGDGFPVVNDELFTWPARRERMDFICMRNTRYDRNQDDNGMTYAILGKGSQRFLYGIILGELYSFAEAKRGHAYEKAYYVDLSSCTDIVSAGHFAFSSLKTFMYYAVGRKVYRVNFSNSTPVAELQFELPEGEEISCLKFYLWKQEDPENRSYDLIVGSKNSATGERTLRIYDGFSSEGNFRDAEPVEMYGGFADIVDVIYRENIIYRQ